MGRFNLSQWAIEHQTLMVFFMILIFGAGVGSYFRLGQNEDPNFTIQTMVVKAYLPGASMEETTRQLTDRLEKKLQETPNLEYLKSYTTPGETTIFVTLMPSTQAEDVPDCWYQVRKKMTDLAPELPAETLGPYFNDEFGDVYGIIYAFTADGFTHRELKDHVEEIRRELLRVQDVAKITTIGDQEEKYYVEFSPHTLATMGISRSAIIAAVTRQNALTPSGVVDTGEERISVETTGRFDSLEDLAGVTIYAGDRRVRLSDIAKVTRGYADPPSTLFRYNGTDAIGLGVSMRNGGDVLQLEKNMAKAMEQIIANLPLGIEAHLVSNQPSVVRMAVHDFMKTLFEAVVIVLVLSFLSLGLRAGAVVAFSIPFVLALTFVGMYLMNIDLQRVSLGALIISLGLLVDDAMITIESMVSRLERGWKLKEAACYAYTATAFPMLTGTLVTICGFIPIGLTRSMAGEYCFSLFAVVAMSLLFSWFVAVLFAPPLGMKVLYEGYRPKDVGSKKLQRFFELMLMAAIRHPKKTVAVTVAVFALSIAGMQTVPVQFFPQSERPELLVDMMQRQGQSITSTDRISKRVDEWLAADPDVDHWSSYVGRGAIRFYLPLDEQLPNNSFAQTVVITSGTEARARVQERLRAKFAEEFPEVLARVTPMEMGPPVGWPLGYRVSGKDPRQV
ncbi:MAG: efflux RND transporter permease subunit, partial [Desulfovibrionaceae bacterium]|nr:efflux RND transporter permease subunit [Desulfovibrionaceae bacterium]